MDRIRDTSKGQQKISSEEIGKALGSSKMLYVGRCNDPLEMLDRMKRIAKIAQECDVFDEEPHDEPLTDD